MVAGFASGAPPDFGPDGSKFPGGGIVIGPPDFAGGMSTFGSKFVPDRGTRSPFGVVVPSFGAIGGLALPFGKPAGSVPASPTFGSPIAADFAAPFPSGVGRGVGGVGWTVVPPIAGSVPLRRTPPGARPAGPT